MGELVGGEGGVVEHGQLEKWKEGCMCSLMVVTVAKRWTEVTLSDDRGSLVHATTLA